MPWSLMSTKANSVASCPVGHRRPHTLDRLWTSSHGRTFNVLNSNVVKSLSLSVKCCVLVQRSSDKKKKLMKKKFSPKIFFAEKKKKNGPMGACLTRADSSAGDRLKEDDDDVVEVLEDVSSKHDPLDDQGLYRDRHSARDTMRSVSALTLSRVSVIETATSDTSRRHRQQSRSRLALTDKRKDDTIADHVDDRSKSPIGAGASVAEDEDDAEDDDPFADLSDLSDGEDEFVIPLADLQGKLSSFKEDVYVESHDSGVVEDEEEEERGKSFKHFKAKRETTETVRASLYDDRERGLYICDQHHG